MELKLRELIERKYGSSYRFKKALGLPADLYSILRGRRAPSENWISKVSADLGVNVRDFLDDRGLLKDV